MPKLLIGTGNRKKLAELTAFFRGSGITLVTPDQLVPEPTAPIEDGSTFEENARIKALAYAGASGLPCLADDSGLEVDALGGRPGVRSARYSGEHATDASNNALMLNELRGVDEARRGAGYVAVLVLARPGEVVATARGGCRGRILEEPRGHAGFGYDPLFLIPELGKTFGELSNDEKERLSHRGKALRAIQSSLFACLQAQPLAPS